MQNNLESDFRRRKSTIQVCQHIGWTYHLPSFHHQVIYHRMSLWTSNHYFLRVHILIIDANHDRHQHFFYRPSSSVPTDMNAKPNSWNVLYEYNQQHMLSTNLPPSNFIVIHSNASKYTPMLCSHPSFVSTYSNPDTTLNQTRRHLPHSRPSSKPESLISFQHNQIIWLEQRLFNVWQDPNSTHHTLHS